MDEETLFDCPFCGGSAEECLMDGFHHIRCEDCGCGTAFHVDKKAAIEIWNERVEA